MELTSDLFEKHMWIFSNKSRAQMLYLLEKGDFCGFHLEQFLGIKQPNISKHMDKMITYGFITANKKGFRTIYHLNEEIIIQYRDLFKMLDSIYDGQFKPESAEFKALLKECRNM